MQNLTIVRSLCLDRINKTWNPFTIILYHYNYKHKSLVAPNTCPLVFLVRLPYSPPPPPSSPREVVHIMILHYFTLQELSFWTDPELPNRTPHQNSPLCLLPGIIYPPCSSNHDFQKVLKGGPIPKISGTFLYKNVWLIMGRLFNPSNNSLFGWIKKVNLIFEQPPLLPVLHRYWCLVNVETMTLFQNWDGWIRTLTSLIL